MGLRLSLTRRAWALAGGFEMRSSLSITLIALPATAILLWACPSSAFDTDRGSVNGVCAANGGLKTGGGHSRQRITKSSKP